MRGFALCAIVLASLLTCSGVDNFEVDAEGEAVIPARSVVDELLGTLAFGGFSSFDLTQEQEFRNQGYTRDQIDEARLSSFTLTVTAPETGNFDWLERITFVAEAEGEPAVEIARLDPVPEGSNVLELDVLDVDLTPYVVAPTMTIRTQATGTRPEEQTTVRARVVVDVDVNVSGSCSS